MTKRATVVLLVLLPALLLGGARLEAAVTLAWSTGSTSGCQAGPAVEVLPGQRLHYFFKMDIVGINRVPQLLQRQRWEPGGRLAG